MPNRKRFRFPKVLMITLLFILFVTSASFCTSSQSWAQSRPAEAKKPIKAGKIGFDRLKGAWRRQDGGYIIQITEIKPDGRMVANYFNPRPINVARAEALQEGQEVKVFLELQDINYPGATYNLTYDAPSDQLKGVYFQPAIPQCFDVIFIRSSSG